MSQLPNAIAKRDLLFGAKKATAEEWKSMAAAFEGADWTSDAADFRAQALDKEALRALRTQARDEGNSFLFLKTSRLLAEEDLPGLLQCALNAEEQGKIRYAIRAHEKLENKEELIRLRALVSEDGDIVAEAESQVFIPPSEEDIIEEENE